MVVIKSAALPIVNGPNAGRRLSLWLHGYDAERDSHVWTRDVAQAQRFTDAATAHAYWLVYLRHSTLFHEVVSLEWVAA